MQKESKQREHQVRLIAAAVPDGLRGGAPNKKNKRLVQQVTESFKGHRMQKVSDDSEELFALWAKRHGIAGEGGRILEYGVDGDTRYREVDFVVGNDESPIILIEIKFSGRPKPYGNKARVQLRETLHIARTQWPQLGGCVLFFDTSSLFKTGFFAYSLTALADVPSLLLSSSQALNVSTIYVDAKELIDSALQHGDITSSWLSEAQDSHSNAQLSSFIGTSVSGEFSYAAEESGTFMGEALRRVFAKQSTDDESQ